MSWRKSTKFCARGEEFRRGDALVNRFRFVADHQRRYDVQRLCTILGVVRSSFHYRRRTAADRAARQAADARLPARIRAVLRESHGTAASLLLWIELRYCGWQTRSSSRLEGCQSASTGGTPFASSELGPLKVRRAGAWG